ncbi:MAG: helix-turn-helix transcriptional regulator [Bacteroidales bacterium]|nr:helix-turn-helix transcriptional regulator [Clostridium sp.]MCM1204505.1 helix-turn-helix transcriptional regulator [Bacteroidales bacterium]
MAVSKEKIASGQRLKILREQLGYTQEQFAEKLDISVSTVKKMETGEHNISLDTQRKLRAAFEHISIEYLLFGEQREISDIWAQIMVLDEWDKLILFQRLLAHFGLNDKTLANKEIDEEKMRRMIQYFKESFKG